jgi:hypothetical protein
MTSLPKLPEPSELRDPPIRATELTMQAMHEIAERLLSESDSMHVLLVGDTRSGVKGIIEGFLIEAGAKFRTDGHSIELENGAQIVVIYSQRCNDDDRMTGITKHRNFGTGVAS